MTQPGQVVFSKMEEVVYGKRIRVLVGHTSV